MATEGEAPIVAYMAVQFRGVGGETNGWVHTTWGDEMAPHFNPKMGRNSYDLLPIDTSGATAPPNINCYAPVRTLQFSVKREYPGSPSGGGAATATRGENSDVFVQRNVDQVSPYFMQYGLTGMLLQNVHLVYNVPGGSSKPPISITWLWLTDAIVTGYYYDTTSTEGEEDSASTVDHYETLTLWYSTVSFKSYTTTKGWSVLTDSIDDALIPKSGS